jgi:hypothetical protein
MDIGLRDSSGSGRNSALAGEGGAAFVDASPFVLNIGTGSDVVTYDPPLVGFRAATAGNVNVTSNGNTFVILNVLAGEHVPGSFTAIKSTSTTATGIIAWQR